MFILLSDQNACPNDDLVANVSKLGKFVLFSILRRLLVRIHYKDKKKKYRYINSTIWQILHIKECVNASALYYVCCLFSYSKIQCCFLWRNVTYVNS